MTAQPSHSQEAFIGLKPDLAAAYQQMAAEEEREAEALEWAEETLEDITNSSCYLASSRRQTVMQKPVSRAILSQTCS
ncbi:MAG TPA: hypothetical protein VFB38_17660 [Chthonomonadaceae bacterium]|nr:hypothetical protein [Chthonomonadaceae bacterium]